jgi:hypothetical protein
MNITTPEKRYAALILALSLYGSPAVAGEVVSMGAPRSAPACHAKADLLSLIAAISAKDGPTILELTAGKRCWGVWDGSIGHLIEQDERSALSLVAFSNLAKLPAGRTETLWIETTYLSARD